MLSCIRVSYDFLDHSVANNYMVVWSRNPEMLTKIIIYIKGINKTIKKRSDTQIYELTDEMIQRVSGMTK